MFPALDLYDTDPAQLLRTAGEDVDYLYVDDIPVDDVPVDDQSVDDLSVRRAQFFPSTCLGRRQTTRF